ncbi:sensor histidine kinase [Flavobacterium sp.]|uniref:sensor histidine kinase n=1 Tax=Flavobacterium sp. TaxID=239 RepID=UPI0039E717DE
MSYYQLAIEEPKIYYEHPWLYAIVLTNIADAQLKLGNKSNFLNYYWESIQISKKLQNNNGLYFKSLKLYSYYKSHRERDSSFFYVKNAYKIAKETGILGWQIRAIDSFSKVDRKNHELLMQERIKLSDSLISNERELSKKLYQIEFDSDTLNKEKEKAEHEREQILLILVLVLFSGGLLLIILWQRNRQKQLVLINNQQKASEEIYQLMLDQQIKFDEGREKEKKRISRELHDGVMNRLAGIRYNLFKLEKKQDTETIENCLQHIAELHTVEKDVREIAHDLNFEVFSNKNNYVTLLHTLIKDNEDEFLYIDLDVTESIQWESIPSLVKMNCYRIIQEALTNIKKHAKATKVNINFNSQPNRLSISIIDNGIGFNPNKIKLGLGLKNIKERAEALEATIKIQSKEQKGTKIEIQISI